MLIIRDRNDTFGLGALGGSLGFLLGALGGSLGLTSGALGCSSVSLGVLLVPIWMLLRLLRHRLGAPGWSKTSFNQHCISNVDFLKLLLLLTEYCCF